MTHSKGSLKSFYNTAKAHNMCMHDCVPLPQYLLLYISTYVAMHVHAHTQ